MKSVTRIATTVLALMLGSPQSTSLSPQFDLAPTQSNYDDDFNSAILSSKWQWVREVPDHWTLAASSGYLRMITQPKDIWRSNNTAPLLLQNLQTSNESSFEIRTRIVINPQANHHQGGLVIYDDDNNYVRLTYAFIDGLKFEFAREIGGNFETIQVAAPPTANGFHLAIAKLDQVYRGYFSHDGVDWTLIGAHSGTSITARRIGLSAFNSYNNTFVEIPADFDYFSFLPRLSCDVPFFWQRDPNATNSHPLRGSCGTSYDTLGEGGCTLTSATMLFRHYGAGTTTSGTEMTPANLSDCMNNNACPFSWISGAACSNSKASNPRRYSSFSYERLDQELNQNHHPIILQMCKKSDCAITHWVLVTGGQGIEPANYTIWDPWFKCGQNMRLQSRNDAWNFIGMAIYDGTPTCGFSTEVPVCALSVSPVGIPSGNVAITGQARDGFADLNASSAISGSATLYRATNISMTVELTAQSSISNVIEMLIWSDTLSNTTWQPYAPYVWLPQSNLVYGRFRDAAGNVSEVVSDTINPSAPPVAPDPVRIQLPLIRR